MLIIWGKKYTYRNLGFAADFCPICRSGQAFRLRAKNLTPHIYYIPSGTSVFVSNERSCLNCDVAFDADTSRYATLARKPGSFAQLKPQTFPDFETAVKARLDLEAAIRANPAVLAAGDRQALIRQPLHLLAPKVENALAKTQLDRDVGYSVIAIVAIVWLGIVIANKLVPDDAATVSFTLMGLGLLALVVQVALGGRRYLRREIAPMLANCLAPLKPTRQELDTAVSELKQKKLKIGQKLDVADLMRRVETAGA